VKTARVPALPRPTSLPDLGAKWRRISPWLAGLFCFVVGPPLMLDGITGLIFAGTGLSVGSNLPHREWNWFFEFNDWHHILHIVSGGILVIALLRRKWWARGVLAFGAIYVILTPLAILDGDDIGNVVFSDGRDNVVHAVLAAAGVFFGVTAGALRRSQASEVGRATYSR
jgi:hypothetical protein